MHPVPSYTINHSYTMIYVNNPASTLNRTILINLAPRSHIPHGYVNSVSKIIVKHWHRLVTDRHRLPIVT